MKTTTFTVLYKAGHSYNERWDYDEEMFCPNCGVKGIWFEWGEGDYYLGPTHICLACNAEFSLPSLRVISNEADEPYPQRFKALQKAMGDEA